MLFKDTEADKKICPLTIGHEMPASSGCFGSACAAWRFANDKGVGYCGMAGAPAVVLWNVQVHAMRRVMNPPAAETPESAKLPDLATVEPQGRA